MTAFLFRWRIFPSPHTPISILSLKESEETPKLTNSGFLADISVVDGYRATVAVEGAFSRLETYTQTCTC